MERLFVIARHAESTLNHERRVNGDPAVSVPLTEKGAEEARELGVQIAHVPIDVCVHTRFGRTRDTAAIALVGSDVPFREEPLLDDIDVGDLEGKPIDEYRAWKHGHERSHPFPAGESLDAAALRFADGWERVLELDAEVVFVVTHEIPLRYLLNGAGGSHELDGPVHELRNATPYLVGEDALVRGIERIRALTGHPAEAR